MAFNKRNRTKMMERKTFSNLQRNYSTLAYFFKNLIKMFSFSSMNPNQTHPHRLSQIPNFPNPLVKKGSWCYQGPGEADILLHTSHYIQCMEIDWELMMNPDHTITHHYELLIQTQYLLFPVEARNQMAKKLL